MSRLLTVEPWCPNSLSTAQLLRLELGCARASMSLARDLPSRRCRCQAGSRLRPSEAVSRGRTAGAEAAIAGAPVPPRAAS
eukprot:10862899-Lingulodinium_polyedra.AAC.1